MLTPVQFRETLTLHETRHESLTVFVDLRDAVEEAGLSLAVTSIFRRYLNAAGRMNNWETAETLPQRRLFLAQSRTKLEAAYDRAYARNLKGSN